MNPSKLQKCAQEMLERFQIPSVSISWIQEGNVETITAGLRNVEAGVSADAQTLYSIGSCTKSFTAAALAVLCDRGLLSLEDPVVKFIPEFDLYDPQAGHSLTIRDMLCHRCGLPRHELAWYPRLAQYDEQQMINMLRHLKPNAPLRYKWQYQNMMYTLAGFVIERVSGQSWRDFLKENLIIPLGLGEISYDEPDLSASPQRAIGYRHYLDKEGFGQVPYSRLYTMCPAGSLSMTSPQLAKWAYTFTNGGKALDGTQVIPEALCREMVTPQMLVSDPIADPLKGYVDMTAYGLGLFTEIYRGVKIAHHGGHIDGFIADQCIVPDRNFAFCILTNSENPHGPKAMRYTVLDALLGHEMADWTRKFYDFREETRKKQEEALTDRQTAARLSAAYPCPTDLEQLPGEYRDDGYGDITITRDGEDLRIQMGTITLTGFHYRAQYFLFTEPHVLPGIELEAEVETDKDGKVKAFLIALEPTDPQKIRFIKKCKK